MSDNPTPDPIEPSGTDRRRGAEPEPGWERAALERIALAAITEQRAARRWRIFFRFVYLAVLLLIVWGVFDFTGERVTTTGRHTALVTLDGEISSDTNANADDINTALDNAFDDEGTAGVILRINSPGGSPVQAGIINREIRRLRGKYPSIPLYVVVDDMCASGGYYVAAAADKIYVDRASIVGSIGVLMDGFGFTGLMDKLGIQRRLHTSGANKGFFDPFSPETPKMDEHAQQMLDQIHAQFIDAVRQGRGKRLHENPDIFSGLFWTGEQSIALGLADGLGDTDYVAREIIKAPDVVDYTVKESLSDRVARKFGAAVGAAAPRARVCRAAGLVPRSRIRGQVHKRTLPGVRLCFQFVISKQRLYGQQQENRRAFVQFDRGRLFPVRHASARDGLAGERQVDRDADERRWCAGRQQRVEQGAVAVGRLDENLRLLCLAGLQFEISQALCALGGVDGQVALERETLPVQARGHQREQD